MPTSTLEYLLLGLLHLEPGSGYGLRKAIASSPLRSYSDSPGAVYPALRRLAARGWIAAAAPAGGRRRQEFALTARGRAAFAAWLKGGVSRGDVLRPELLLLRFAFMGQVLSPPEVRAFLDEFAREQATQLAALEEYFATNSAYFPVTGRLAFEYGLREQRARLDWIRDAGATIGPAERWP